MNCVNYLTSKNTRFKSNRTVECKEKKRTLRGKSVSALSTSLRVSVTVGRTWFTRWPRIEYFATHTMFAMDALFAMFAWSSVYPKTRSRRNRCCPPVVVHSGRTQMNAVTLTPRLGVNELKVKLS